MFSQRVVLKLLIVLAVLAGVWFWWRGDSGTTRGAPEATGDSASAGLVARLAWLAGCWRHDESGFRREEQWMEPLGGTMIGMSRTVAGGTTVEHEYIRIETRNDLLFFVANPSGQAEAEFRQYALSDSSAAFEAPEHDFPQRIIYRRLDARTAVASIEGELDGLTRVIDFPLSRTNCP